MTSRSLLSPTSAQHRRHAHAMLLVAAVALPASIFILFVFFFLYCHFSNHRMSNLPFESLLPSRLRRFSYSDLFAATAGFDPSRSLGRGASAAVFRGILADGKSVAVKRLDLSPSLSAPSFVDREFQNELQMLANLPYSPFVVSLLGYCFEGSNRRLLVYEYMSNGSLQDGLFGPRHSHIDWNQRYRIIIDIAQALAFLHHHCDPPVIHGDIKPSNILLGPDFQAKISDFGLSRMKTEAAASPAAEIFSQELSPSQELFSGSPQLDFSLTVRASSSNSYMNREKVNPVGVYAVESPVGKESSLLSRCDELGCVDRNKELGGNATLGDGSLEASRVWVKDWWWKQDGNSELGSKDYVREWIGSQICSSKDPVWEDDRRISPEFRNSSVLLRLEDGNLGEAPFGNSLQDDYECEQEKRHSLKVAPGCSNKDRKMKEWWKEEYFAEISKKGNRHNRRKLFKSSSGSHMRKNSNSVEYDDCRGCTDSTAAIRPGEVWKSKKKKSRSVSNETNSGDLFSKELSSTTSMRGTVCYVAPECRGCGHLMEKADIYSFGVLILVIISGRRPLHVLQSPMKLDKANLICWCRQLAHTGNLLDIVDEKLNNSYNKYEVILCINLALLCLQRMPDLRPESVDIVKILKGEMGLPVIPFEASPSPTSKHFSRSKRRVSNDAELCDKDVPTLEKAYRVDYKIE
ncbi:hypothetical protein HPP92_003760 [Vanilla planifolia]|uniref:Protein kinase domain-containing protein n=1 Tax=Vanilla planifolia TaxID=51239 RepID=A0A835RVP9_VANPL|nr:hypothetical protein HPP92_003760 [Vanilla planifolia]